MLFPYLLLVVQDIELLFTRAEAERFHCISHCFLKLSDLEHFDLGAAGNSSSQHRCDGNLSETM